MMGDHRRGKRNRLHGDIEKTFVSSHQNWGELLSESSMSDDAEEEDAKCVLYSQDPVGTTQWRNWLGGVSPSSRMHVQKSF